MSSYAKPLLLKHNPMTHDVTISVDGKVISTYRARRVESEDECHFWIALDDYGLEKAFYRLDAPDLEDWLERMKEE